MSASYSAWSSRDLSLHALVGSCRLCLLVRSTLPLCPLGSGCSPSKLSASRLLAHSLASGAPTPKVAWSYTRRCFGAVFLPCSGLDLATILRGIAVFVQMLCLYRLLVLTLTEDVLQFNADRPVPPASPIQVRLGRPRAGRKQHATLSLSQHNIREALSAVQRRSSASGSWLCSRK